MRIPSIASQIESIDSTERGVLPLMQDMIDGLVEDISSGVPFLLDEREDRIARLQDLLIDPEISVAELYRRVLEAYQIESDYGRTLEAWRGQLPTGEQERVVEFLRIGRLMLFYQSLDGQEQGYWDAAAGRWQVLPASYRRALSNGIAIARNEQSPQLLRLPMPAVSAEVAQ